MDFDNYDYESDLAIDPHMLDEEWLTHPQLFMKYSEAAARADKKVLKCHEKVKVVRSELVKEASEKTMDNGKSPTGQWIESYYRTHEKHIEAKDELIEAEFEANLLRGAVFAFTHRKKSLENLVSLWIGEYFSGPKEPRELREGKRILAGKKEKDQNEKLNRKRRRKKDAN